MADFRWHGDAILRQIDAEMTRRLKASAILLTNHVRQMISVEGAGLRSVSTAAATKAAHRKLQRYIKNYNRAVVHGKGGYKVASLTKKGAFTFRKPPRARKKPYRGKGYPLA